jgi:uncharacterized membrane protein YphA (DoxX/SURF4 family)
MMLHWVRRTNSDRLAGVVRLMLGVVFVMTGVMKLVIPMLADAWSGQLLAANLPFYTLTRWTVPFVEMALGCMLLAGLFARLASFAVIGVMMVATYTHLVVDDATLFPLQPSEPVVPIIVMVMSALILWRGAGAWSLDLKATAAKAPWPNQTYAL